MRFEVELWGTVLSFSLGPAYTVEEEPAEYVHDRLYMADATHAGEQEDPVFPKLDWGDDEEGERRRRAYKRAGVPMDLGHSPGREPDPPVRGGTPFGFLREG